MTCFKRFSLFNKGGIGIQRRPRQSIDLCFFSTTVTNGTFSANELATFHEIKWAFSPFLESSGGDSTDRDSLLIQSHLTSKEKMDASPFNPSTQGNSSVLIVSITLCTVDGEVIVLWCSILSFISQFLSKQRLNESQLRDSTKQLVRFMTSSTYFSSSFNPFIHSWEPLCEIIMNSQLKNQLLSDALLVRSSSCMYPGSLTEVDYIYCLIDAPFRLPVVIYNLEDYTLTEEPSSLDSAGAGAESGEEQVRKRSTLRQHPIAVITGSTTIFCTVAVVGGAVGLIPAVVIVTGAAWISSTLCKTHEPLRYHPKSKLPPRLPWYAPRLKEYHEGGDAYV